MADVGTKELDVTVVSRDKNFELSKRSISSRSFRQLSKRTRRDVFALFRLTQSMNESASVNGT